MNEELDESTGAVRADPAQIGIVVLNLASNAADALKGATGEMTMALSRVEVDTALAALHVNLAPGSYAKLSVSDSGLGMDDETKRQIFDPFFTTKDIGDGTGLGLSSVFGVVSTIGGTVDVSSAPGAGTTIDVYLPLADTLALSKAS